MLIDARTPTAFVVSPDDDALEALRASIDGAGRAVQAFATLDEFRAACDPPTPGCLLLDVHSPVSTALERYQRMVREGWRLPVVFLVSSGERWPGPSTNTTGAIAYVERNCQREILLDAVDRALAVEGQWRQREAADLAVTARIAQLSDREHDALDLMLIGASDRVMASRLYVSRQAVEMRRQAIMRKLKVRSHGELLATAITQRILAEIAVALAEAWRRG